MELADQRPDAAIGQVFLNSADLLATLLRQLLPTPSMRWEKSRIGFLAQSFAMDCKRSPTMA